MKAIAVTKLSERRTRVVCGNRTFYVNQTEPEKFIVDDGEDRKAVTATSAEDAVEDYLSPPAAMPRSYPAFPTAIVASPFTPARPSPSPQYTHHKRGTA